MKLWLKGGLIGGCIGLLPVFYIIFNHLYYNRYDLLLDKFTLSFLFVILLIGFSIGAFFGLIIDFIKEKKTSEAKKKKRSVIKYGLIGLVIAVILNVFLFALNLLAMIYISGEFGWLAMSIIFLFIPIAIIGFIIGIVIGTIKKGRSIK